MLFGLKRRQRRIETGLLDEAAVYRDANLHRLPRSPGRVAPGVLQCPICGLSARRFLPFGLAGRRNALCPGCGSVERHRMLWLFLSRRTRLLQQRCRILHTAPEPALEVRLRRRHGRLYCSVDRFDPGADVNADLTALPFADGRFDVILSSHVLEHIPDDRAAIAELARVLRPGGWGVILVPYDSRRPTREDPAIDTPALRMAAYGHPFHYRIFGIDLLDRLAAAGLTATPVRARQWLSGHQRRRYRINDNTLLVVHKPARAG